MTVKITTHYQVTVSERREMGRGLSERNYGENRAGYCQRRTWSNTTADKEARMPRFSFVGPDWLMPKRLARLMATCTFTIWGTAGRMADVAEQP